MASGSDQDYVYSAVPKSVAFTFTPPSGSNIQFEFSDESSSVKAGSLETATSTVSISGSSAPTSGSILVARSATEAIWQPAMVFGEQPAGTKNGVNMTFTLNKVPINGTDLMLFVNGLFQTSGSSNDYELTGSTINFTLPPLASDSINSIYRPSY